MRQLAGWWFTILATCMTLIHLVGCSSGPEPLPRMIAEPREYAAQYERTWSALNDVLSEKRLPIRSFEKDSGLVTTDFVDGRSRYIYWGKKDDSGREISTWADKTRYFLNIRVRNRDGGTTVDVLPHVEFMRYEYNAALKRSVEAGWEACESHGDIERELYEAIGKKLGTR